MRWDETSAIWTLLNSALSWNIYYSTMSQLACERWILFWYVTVVLLVVTLSELPRETGSLTYQLIEEQPEGTFVADLRRDSNLQAIIFTKLVFSSNFFIFFAYFLFFFNLDYHVFVCSNCICIFSFLLYECALVTFFIKVYLTWQRDAKYCDENVCLSVCL